MIINEEDFWSTYFNFLTMQQTSSKQEIDMYNYTIQTGNESIVFGDFDNAIKRHLDNIVSYIEGFS